MWDMCYIYLRRWLCAVQDTAVVATPGEYGASESQPGSSRSSQASVSSSGHQHHHHHRLAMTSHDDDVIADAADSCDDSTPGGSKHCDVTAVVATATVAGRSPPLCDVTPPDCSVQEVARSDQQVSDGAALCVCLSVCLSH